jgi:hypothetical protein
VNCQGKEKVDPTVYLGTAGVSYALLRATQTEEAMPKIMTEGGEEHKGGEDGEEAGKINAEAIRANFDACHEINQKLVKKDN